MEHGYLAWSLLFDKLMRAGSYGGTYSFIALFRATLIKGHQRYLAWHQFLARVLLFIFAPGNEGLDPPFQDAALQQDAALALEALNPDISPEPDYLPVIAATGVLFLEADHIPQPYLHNHASLPQR